MKNARTYERITKKFLKSLPRKTAGLIEASDPIAVMIRSIFEVDSTLKQAAEILQRLKREFVDYNEMRVSPSREILDLIAEEETPSLRQKAETLTIFLNNLYATFGGNSLDSLQKLSARELRNRLGEMGLPPYGSSVMAMMVFGVPTVPVDQTLVDCLTYEGCVPPGSTIQEVQTFLERIVRPKDAPATHQALRAYVEKQAKVVRKHQQAQQAAQKAQEKQQAAFSRAAKGAVNVKKSSAAKKSRKATGAGKSKAVRKPARLKAKK